MLYLQSVYVIHNFYGITYVAWDLTI